MKPSLTEIIDSYDSSAPLAEASTIPASWYTDERLFELEKQTIFSRSWQFAARIDQLNKPGDYVTDELAGEPIVAVRGGDKKLRAFFNVCRHHAAAVMTERAGHASQMRCPYHGWTYSLEGELKGTPDFGGVCNFDRANNGLVPVEVATWEKWVFARIESGTGVPPVSFITNGSQGTHGRDARGRRSPEVLSLQEFLGSALVDQIRQLSLTGLHWMERRHYSFDCNWKVFVDNYLDGGYHVPYLHKGLDSVLDYAQYTIENGARHCLQKSPIVREGAEPQTGAVRQGKVALYYWMHPNFMINWYEGVMDTN